MKLLATLLTLPLLLHAAGPQPVQPPPPAAVLPIAAFTLSDANGKPLVSLTADGRLTAMDQPAGTIAPSGEVSDPEGKLIATVAANGKVEIRIPEVRAIGSVSAKGFTLPDGNKFTWTPEGELPLGPDGPRIVLDPADTPARKTASLAILLTFSAIPADDD